MKISRSFVAALCILAVVLLSCSRYQTRVVPLKLPSASPNSVEVAGATVAARAYEDRNEARTAFGFDVRGSGVLPVQVVFDNTGAHPLQIVPEQTFLVDVEDNLWPILPSSLTYERIEKKTSLGKVAPGALKYGTLAGLGGAVLGAAIGIVSGQSIGEFAGRGAAIAAAAGATAGGASGLANEDVKANIQKDIQTRTLENRPIKPADFAYGFLFFPGESKQPRELRLRVKETDTGTTHAVAMRLGP